MREDVRLEVCGLCKFLIASIEGTYIRPVPCVDAYVCTKVEIQRESLAAAFKSTLERFFASVHQLVTFQFRALYKGFATFSTDMNTGPVGVQMFPHGRIIAKHLGAPFVRTGNRSGNFFAAIPFGLDPEKTNTCI